jgi:hypothetical protein
MSTIEKNCFFSELTGLQLGTADYVRPYIIVNNQCYLWYNETFVTTSATLQLFETSIVSISPTRALQCGGNIIMMVVVILLSGAFCWGINKNPTVNYQ